jgi:cell division protein FtsQ
MSQDKMLVLLIAIISIIALISFFLSPFFQLRNITIDGLKNISEDEIKRSLSSFQEKNVWLINKDKVKNIILQNKYIKQTVIKKKLPDSLVVNIKERVPIGKINNNGKYLVFDKKGLIMERGSQKTSLPVPEIKGVGYTFENNSLSFTPIFNRIVQALAIMDAKTRGKIKAINFKNNDKVILVLFSQIDVYMGNPEKLSRKFKVLESVIHKIGEENLAVDYVDLKIIKKPVIKLKNK